MPSSINGFGTMWHGYGAATRWSKPGLLLSEKPDHDAVNCFVLIFFPVLPLACQHTFNWNGNQCQVMKLRWNWGLVARAVLRPVSIVALGIGGVWTAIGAYLWFSKGLGEISPSLKAGVGVAVAAFIIGLLLFFWMYKKDKRNRNIRVILGPHPLGSSDPAMWTPEVLQHFSSQGMYGTSAFLEGGRKALEAENYADAMGAARLAVAAGEPFAEEFTDEILENSRIAPILDDLRRKPWMRDEILGAVESAVSRTGVPPGFVPGEEG